MNLDNLDILVLFFFVIGILTLGSIADPVNALSEDQNPQLYIYQFTNGAGMYWYVDAYNCLEYESSLTAGLIAVRCLVPNPDYENPSNLLWENVYHVELIGPLYLKTKGQ